MSVTIGSLDGSLRATVDGRGRVRLGDRHWALGWAVRSDDGWHMPETTRSASLMQRCVDGTPVVETSLRIPSGRAVHAAYAARAADGTEAVVVEVENRSKAPIAVAFDVDGARRIALDGPTYVVDGAPGLVLPRVPSRTATSLADLVADGGTTDWPGDVRARWRDGRVALVVPLAHTARVRVVVGATLAPDRLPDVAAVTAGWLRHLDAGLRFDAPDAELVEQARRSLADLLLADRLDAAAVVALDRFGQHAPARSALWTMVDEQRLHVDRGEPIVALAAHARLADAEELVRAAVGPVAAAAHRVRRTGEAAVQLAAAQLLDAAGQPDAASVCRSRVDAAAAAADSGGVGAAPDSPAGRLLRIHAALVADGPSGPVLAPAWPDDWLGRGVEVHDAPTPWGLLSYAIRWHGPRPAVLWERAGTRPARMTAGLDPSWSTTEPRGEALLAPVEPAGGLPKVVAPLGDGGTPVDEASADGPGFT